MDGTEQQPHDYDVDKRFARIRVEVLGQEFTDVVRVCERFPGLPDGITVYVEHVGAVGLKQDSAVSSATERLDDHLHRVDQEWQQAVEDGDEKGATYAAGKKSGFLTAIQELTERSVDTATGQERDA